MNDPQEIRQAQIDLAFRREERIEAVRMLMDCKVGRKFIWWLMSQCNIFSSSLAEERVMAFNEGKRTVGLKVFELTQANAENRRLFAEIQFENEEKGTEG